MKYVFLLLLLSGCATTDSKLVSQLLEDIGACKQQSQALVTQCNEAIKNASAPKPAVKK